MELVTKAGLTSLIILKAIDIAREPVKPVRIIGDWDLTTRLNVKIKDTASEMGEGLKT